jgi:cytochrome c biogenesis protein CcmG, thiol:disulfide interchange protein DsbE
MQTHKRFWYGLIAAALLLGGSWILATRVNPDSDTDAGLSVAPRKGFLAPDFTLSLLDGDEIRLSDLRGQPVLINFWASWCRPCRAEMPELQAAASQHADVGLVVLGVNQLEPLSDVSSFVQELALTFPIPLDMEGKVSAAYQVRGLPTSFFVDAEGVIRDAFTGPLSTGLLESKLETILTPTDAD